MSRRGARLCAALVLLATLAGCKTVGPRYDGPPPGAVVKSQAAAAPFVSATGQAFSREPAPGDWWRLYQDPVLDELVRQAFAANTDLRMAEANLERSQALLRQARAARQPSVAVNFDPSYQQLSTESYLQPGVVAPLGLYDTGVAVSYELDLFGRIHRAIQAASADDEAVRAAYDLSKITVAAETARAYADVCGAGEQLAAAGRVLALQKQSYTLTQRLVRSGRGAALDLTRSVAQISQYEANIPALEAARRNALFRLAVLTGRPPSDYPHAAEACTTSPRLSQPIPVGDGALLLRRRPDVRAAERTLAADTDRIGVAMGELYPVVSLGAAAGSTGAIPDIFTPMTNRYGFGPNIQWQLNQNAPRARVAAAEATTRMALAHFDGVVLNALQEAEAALTTYGQDLQRNADLANVRDRAAQAVGQSRALYVGGRIDFLSYLDAQRSLASADTALAASAGQLSADQVAIFLALGGGWESSAPSPAVRK